MQAIDILIETGTYLGEMALASKRTFKKIYTIELDKELYRKAKNNCSKYDHIKLYQGDSAQVLPEILLKVNFF